MADKAITDLNVVPGSIDDGNTWFAVAQSGAAYKVSGHQFITALSSLWGSHGGIRSIVYTEPVAPSLTGTLTITMADDTVTSFDVDNGKGITSITKTGSSGLEDYYEIAYNDGTSTSFTVTNGEKGDTGDPWYVWIRYAGTEPTQDSDIGTDPDNWMGVYSGTSSTAPVHYTDYDWFQIKGAKGDTGEAAMIVTQAVTYQQGDSPNIQPTGTWTTTIPIVAQGNYLWTKTEIVFNSGSPVTFYSVARMGLDGAGSVTSVNGLSPDTNGNVSVTASDIQTTDSTSVQSDLSGLKNSLNQSLAYVENGNSASRTYSAGTFISWKGTLYIVKVAIPASTAFAVGINLEIPHDSNNVGYGGLNALRNESGTGFLKFPDGTLFCWGRFLGSSTSTTQLGSLYTADVDLGVTFPVAFISTPSVQYSPASDAQNIVLRYVSGADLTNTGIGRITIARASAGNLSPNISWLAIGRWK